MAINNISFLVLEPTDLPQSSPSINGIVKSNKVQQY